MTDPQQILYEATASVWPCHDRKVIHTVSDLTAGWRHEFSFDWLWFWIDLFVKDPELRRRMVEAHQAIPKAFGDLARLHLAVYGTRPEIPQAIVDLVRRRVLTAWFENGWEVLEFARGTATERVASEIKRRIEVDKWLKGS